MSKPIVETVVSTLFLLKSRVSAISFALKFIAFLCFFLLSGCAGTPPILEYNKAALAYKNAKRSNAKLLSRQHWQRAVKLYKRGQFFYQERQYEKAKTFFERSLIFFERAETHSTVKKFKKGDL